MIFEVSRFQVARRDPVLRQRKAGPVVGDQPDRLIVVLAEAVHSDARVVTCRYRGERDLRARVLRSAMLRRADRRVIGVAIVVGAVVVIERRYREQQAGPEGMHPREARQGIAFALHVANACRLGIRIVGESDSRRAAST